MRNFEKIVEKFVVEDGMTDSGKIMNRLSDEGHFDFFYSEDDWCEIEQDIYLMIDELTHPLNAGV